MFDAFWAVVYKRAFQNLGTQKLCAKIPRVTKHENSSIRAHVIARMQLVEKLNMPEKAPSDVDAPAVTAHTLGCGTNVPRP